MDEILENKNWPQFASVLASHALTEEDLGKIQAHMSSEDPSNSLWILRGLLMMTDEKRTFDENMGKMKALVASLSTPTK